MGSAAAGPVRDARSPGEASSIAGFGDLAGFAVRGDLVVRFRGEASVGVSAGSCGAASFLAAAVFRGARFFAGALAPAPASEERLFPASEGGASAKDSDSLMGKGAVSIRKDSEEGETERNWKNGEEL